MLLTSYFKLNLLRSQIISNAVNEIFCPHYIGFDHSVYGCSFIVTNGTKFVRNLQVLFKKILIILDEKNTSVGVSAVEVKDKADVVESANRAVCTCSTLKCLFNSQSTNC